MTDQTTQPLDTARWNAMTLKRLDGLDPFVIAVRTTGIYCRVGCPARTPHRENVLFLDSIGQAQERGFRACKRCHPGSGDLPPWRPKRDMGKGLSAIAQPTLVGEG